MPKFIYISSPLEFILLSFENQDTESFFPYTQLTFENQDTESFFPFTQLTFEKQAVLSDNLQNLTFENQDNTIL